MNQRLQHIVEHYDEMCIGTDEHFRFHCKQCGKCCINREDILLNPKDLYNISKELGLAPRDTIAQYCEVYLGQNSRIPIVRLKPRGSIKRCPLLRDRKCSVHNAKPTVCALFPLGRSIKLDAKETDPNAIERARIQYIINSIECGDRSEEHTVREWVESFGICRFARNVVDTLVVTRELKSIGVEVYFIDDNIWTMDGDGELRLSLMATLAQEESRKTSERVKAGQKISRDNGVLYGNGNILGYDRVGDTYVINEEQAETVRMIFDLYLQGFGSMKIAQILTERKRKTATGLIKWSVSNIMRAIKNATYTGTKCYNKSRSNNFLEQKRINNLDMSTYEYVEGDFPAIVSQEIWDKAQAIRESRMKPALVSAEKTTHSKRDSRDIWVNKLRCSCGSSYRKNKWHTKLDGKTSYGYQCYNQLNNGIRRKRAEIGLDTEGYCDSRMITDWKLDFMAKALLEHLWQERKESVLIALDLIRHYYKEERTLDNKSDAASIQARIDKANSRLANLIAMRADGEISKDEYQSMRSPIDKEIKELQKALEDTPTNKCCPRGLDLEGIRSTLNSLIDFSGSTISHDVINQFVYMVTPTSDTTFDWYVNLNGTADVKATFTAEGRKKSCIIKLEEIEKISSLHRKENEDNAHLIKNPIVFAFLHRLPLRTSSK